MAPSRAGSCLFEPLFRLKRKLYVSMSELKKQSSASPVFASGSRRVGAGEWEQASGSRSF